MNLEKKFKNNDFYLKNEPSKQIQLINDAIDQFNE
jgi:hypothetical protein